MKRRCGVDFSVQLAVVLAGLASALGLMQLCISVDVQIVDADMEKAALMQLRGRRTSQDCSK
jgi:hypothetical protein